MDIVREEIEQTVPPFVHFTWEDSDRHRKIFIHDVETQLLSFKWAQLV